MQGHGLSGGTHHFPTSPVGHKPCWTCKTAQTRHHLAAVWWPAQNELVVAIQFPLDRCPLHKESITLSSLLGKEETGLGMETAWTCSAQPGCLLSRTEVSRRDEGKQYVSSSWRRALCLLIHRTPYKTPQSTSQTLSHLSYHKAMFFQTRFWLTEPHSGGLLRSPPGY